MSSTSVRLLRGGTPLTVSLLREALKVLIQCFPCDTDLFIHAERKLQCRRSHQIKQKINKKSSGNVFTTIFRCGSSHHMAERLISRVMNFPYKHFSKSRPRLKVLVISVSTGLAETSSECELCAVGARGHLRPTMPNGTPLTFCSHGPLSVKSYRGVNNNLTQRGSQKARKEHLTHLSI